MTDLIMATLAEAAAGRCTAHSQCWSDYGTGRTVCSARVVEVVYQGQQANFTPLEGGCRQQIMMMTQMNKLHSSGGRMLTTNNDDVDPNELWFRSTDVHPLPTTAAHLLRRSLLLLLQHILPLQRPVGDWHLQPQQSAAPRLATVDWGSTLDAISHFITAINLINALLYIKT